MHSNTPVRKWEGMAFQTKDLACLKAVTFKSNRHTHEMGHILWDKLPYPYRLQCTVNTNNLAQIVADFYSKWNVTVFQ